MIKGLEHCCQEEKLRELCLFRPEKRWLNRDLMKVCQYLKGRCQDNGARPFLVVSTNRSGGNVQKQIHRIFLLNMRRNLFTVWMAKHLDRLPRKIVESPSLRTLKNHPDAVLCHVLWDALLEQEGWTTWFTVVLLNPIHSVVL